MQDQIGKYFENKKAVYLSEAPNLTWEEAQKGFPCLTKGWYELCHLSSIVRLEFLRDYWVNALPYSPQLYAFVDRFFAKVEEIGMVAAKGKIFLTYSMKANKSFFLGEPPLMDQEIKGAVRILDISLPQDFLQFFRVHNGFFKGGDTGIFSIGVLVKEAERFKSLNQSLMIGNQLISSSALLPFYRPFGLDVYQCFYQDWHPDGGVGNVLCSLSEGTISDYRTKDKGREHLAFHSFIEWLMFYMEDVDVQ